MISAAPRKNANGEPSIRPYRIGTSSGTRLCGLLLEQRDRIRPVAAGSHAPWLDLGACVRAAFRARPAPPR